MFCKACRRRRVCKLVLMLLILVTIYNIILISFDHGETVDIFDFEEELEGNVNMIVSLTEDLSKHVGTINSTYNRLKSVFEAGKWKSDFVSPYHKHYDVNCSAILSGHNETIEDISRVISLQRGPYDNISLNYPSDRDVVGWTGNCQDYRKNRKYPVVPRSLEEANFPLAYIFTVHKQAAQVERLFRAIYQPQNVYCFHVDKKAPKDLHEAIRKLTSCFDNTFVASKLEDVQYGGFTRLQADLNCMSDLMAKQWKYVINLCGQDFPLKTNLEIVRQMKALKGKNDIPGVYPVQNQWFIGRTRFHHEYIKGQWRKTFKRKPPPPHAALMYFGNAYYAATREFMDYVLTNEIAIDLLKYLSDSHSPDEHYWVTVSKYPGAPGGFTESTWASNIRFIKWTNSDEYAPCVGKWVRMVCIIGTGYLPYVSTLPHLFMNKVHYDYDPVPMQCMEELLDFRTKVPDSVREFVSEFPVTNLFNVSADHKPEHLYRFMAPLKEPPPIGAVGLFVIFLLVISIIIIICQVKCIQSGPCDEEPLRSIQYHHRRHKLRHKYKKMNTIIGLSDENDEEDDDENYDYDSSTSIDD